MNHADVAEGVQAAMHAYVQALDDGRTDDVVDTYVADGVFDSGALGVFEGHAALREAYVGWKPVVPQRHVMANTVVTDWTDDTARATSDVIFMVKGDTAWSVQLVGRYEDSLRYVDGRWRFERRVLRFES
ncbi:MAG: nuclear transport factor 2 family protein [Acidimicrobiales bacterium]|nr:nuclear transport factor 2 family protein [Acidimicrobiales bacterium]